MKLYIHWQIERLITRALAGDCNPVLKRLLDNHLAQCSSCRQKWEESLILDKTIHDAFPVITPSRKLYKKIQSDIASYPEYNEPRRANQQQSPYIVWAFSTTFALILGVFLYFVVTPRPLVTDIRIAGNGISYRNPHSSYWIPLTSPEQIRPGGFLKTDAFTLASGKLGKTSQFWLNRGTEVQIGEGFMEPIDLVQGDIQIRVNHHPGVYSVGTPNGMVDVYGTEFRISGKRGEPTLVTCLQSTVYFRNSYGRAVIPQGYQSLVPVNQRPDLPKQFTTQKIKDLRNYLEWYNQISDSERDSLFDNYLQLGQEEYEKQDYSKAAEYFRMVILLHPDRREGYHKLGITLQEMEEYPEAMASVVRAISLDTSKLGSYYVLGSIYCETGRFDEAEHIAEFLVKRNAPNHANWLLYGDALLWQGKNDQAKEMYEKSLTLNPCDYCTREAHAGLALIYARKGDQVKSMNELKYFQNLGNELQEKAFYNKLAYTYLALGLPRDERFCWDKYIASFPKTFQSDYGRQRLQTLDKSL